MRQLAYIIIFVSYLILLCGCTSTRIRASETPAQLNLNANYGITPFKNQTTTPLVGKKVTAMTAALLHSLGIDHFVTYSSTLSEKQEKAQDLLSANDISRQQLLDWAKKEKVKYILSGNVTEWRYKVGLDGEPVVGMTMHLIRVSDNKTIWSSVGSKRGSPKDSLSGIGQSLVAQLLEDMIADSPRDRNKIVYSHAV